MLDRLKSFLGEIRRPGSTMTLDLNSVIEDRPISTQVPQPPPEVTAKAKPGELPGLGALGFSFAVDDVVPASDPLWQGSLMARISVAKRGDSRQRQDSRHAG